MRGSQKFALLAVTALAVSCTPQAAGTIDPSQHSSTYTDPNLGWSWSYPPNWHLQTFSGGFG
ncbi:MAG: hypothetical protein M3P01_05105, partial [Actinomycetota bacterium]|nr:hypothetical protein [Actinomycetota bacterium]